MNINQSEIQKHIKEIQQTKDSFVKLNHLTSLRQLIETYIIEESKHIKR